jgi:hypothetical protein
VELDSDDAAPPVGDGMRVLANDTAIDEAWHAWRAAQGCEGGGLVLIKS